LLEGTPDPGVRVCGFQYREGDMNRWRVLCVVLAVAGCGGPPEEDGKGEGSLGESQQALYGQVENRNYPVYWDTHVGCGHAGGKSGWGGPYWEQDCNGYAEGWVYFTFSGQHAVQPICIGQIGGSWGAGWPEIGVSVDGRALNVGGVQSVQCLSYPGGYQWLTGYVPQGYHRVRLTFNNDDCCSMGDRNVWFGETDLLSWQ
jgi:hypothetical protein